jgi:hypothetical protein
MPMIDGITKAIFSGKWHRHTNELFYPVPDGMTPSGIEVACAARDFLQYLASHTSANLVQRDGGNVNYEHLFSLAEIIRNDLSPGAPLRPEVGDFVEKLSNETEHLWKSLGYCSWSGTRNNQLASLAHHAIGLIQGVVRHQLDPSRMPKGFRVLRSIIAYFASFEHIDLVTLNHDLLLESVIEREDYCDGFSDREHDVWFYADDAFKADKRISLLKPHGSINWYRFGKDLDKEHVHRYGKPALGKDPWHARQASGAWFDNVSGDPIFLTGVDKLPKYATGIFAKQVAWFRRFLEKTERVVCSGYGWRDEGMNNLLFEWLDSASTNRLVLLHDGKKIENDLLMNPRCPWSFRYRELYASRQLRVIPKWLCCCKDASEIIAELS